MNSQVSSLLCITAQVIALDVLMSRTLIVADTHSAVDRILHPPAPQKPQKTDHQPDQADLKPLLAPNKGNGVNGLSKEDSADLIRCKKHKSKEQGSCYDEEQGEHAKANAGLYFNLNLKMELKRERRALEASKVHAKMIRKHNKDLEKLRKRTQNKQKQANLRPLSDFERPYEIIMGEKHYIRTETRKAQLGIMNAGELPVSYTPMSIVKSAAAVTTRPPVECVESKAYAEVTYALVPLMKKAPSLWSAATSIESIQLTAAMRAETAVH
jgi:hypothetical protein